MNKYTSNMLLLQELSSDLCGLTGSWSYGGEKLIKLLKICEEGCSFLALFCFWKFQLASVGGDGNAVFSLPL